jgi:hypothetical protein
MGISFILQQSCYRQSAGAFLIHLLTGGRVNTEFLHKIILNALGTPLGKSLIHYGISGIVGIPCNSQEKSTPFH